MFLSGGFSTSIAVVIDYEGDSYDDSPDELDEYLLDSFRTRFRRVSAQQQDPAAVESALRNAAEYLGGTLDAHTDAAGTTFAIHLDPDVKRSDLRDALELYLAPLGVDPGSLLAGLDGIERVEARLNQSLDKADDLGAGGDITQRVINIVVPAPGFTMTSNGDFHAEGARAERERVKDADRQAVISEKAAIKADRERRMQELADRINARLDERQAAAAAPPVETVDELPAAPPAKPTKAPKAPKKSKAVKATAKGPKKSKAPKKAAKPVKATVKAPKVKPVKAAVETWQSVIARAVRGLGGRASLSAIYGAVEQSPRAATSTHWKAKVRQTLQTSPAFARSTDGTWTLTR